jgi:asparaginyl-tRNA synthetase
MKESRSVAKLYNGPTSTTIAEDYFFTVIESGWYKDVALLQDFVTCTTVDFYRNKGIRTLHLPITTGSISSPMGLGSDSSPVEVQIAGERTYLADSMQFMLEFGCRLFPRGAYYIMPSFRGEPLDTRHLCQFFHSEVEIPGGWEEIRTLAEEYVAGLARGILGDSELRTAISRSSSSLSHLEFVANGPSIPCICFEEATTIVSQEHIKRCPGTLEARTISAMGEKELIAYFGGIVWLIESDYHSVPFYQARMEKAGRTYARNGDLLFGMGEVVGAGERHVGGQEVRLALDEHGIEQSTYQWYVNLKERFPMRTSGFGMGIERFLLWALGHDDIRNMQLVPRENGKTIIP